MKNTLKSYSLAIASSAVSAFAQSTPHPAKVGVQQALKLHPVKASIESPPDEATEKAAKKKSPQN
ncbi:MAG: hypothetical protein M3Y24_04825 [Acidobacteriota bacterium]|nr:hypothetical protein [Acidobacteriota bacterium]